MYIGLGCLRLKDANIFKLLGKYVASQPMMIDTRLFIVKIQVLNVPRSSFQLCKTRYSAKLVTQSLSSVITGRFCLH